MDLIRLSILSDAGGAHEGTIRITTIDGERMASAYDVIRLVVQSNERLYWSRLIESHPELLRGSKIYKFGGGGQRETPVIDAKHIVMLLNLMPGKKAAHFRTQCADVIVRYLGGDDTLVDEIIHNAAEQAQMDETNPAHIFGEAVKRKREAGDGGEIDVLSRVRQRDIDTIERATHLLRELSDGALDCPTRMLLRDATQNVLAPICSRLAVSPSDESGVLRRHQMPVSDIYRQVTGTGSRVPHSASRAGTHRG